VAHAADGIAELFWLDGVSYAESAVITAIRRHLQSKKTDNSPPGPAAKEV